MTCKRNRDSKVAAKATAQGGVVSLDQLRETGVSPRAAAGRARGGGLHRVHRGVYAVGHRHLDRIAELRAAQFACGAGAVVSHGTAAALWRLTDREPILIDVTVPVEAGRKIDGVRCRRCRYPQPEEITEYHGVICTTPARTLVDEAGRLGLDMILVDWRSEDDSVPDVRSVFEARALPRLLALGLPRPLVNQPIEADGKTLTPDFLWPDQRLIVETDGRGSHETGVAFQRDRWRDQHFLAAGYRVSRVTWIQLRDDLDGVVARTARALNHRAVP